jgi:hypothetical protein
MITMSTMQDQGHRPGRARHPLAGVRGFEAGRSWRGVSVALASPGCDTTGVVAFPAGMYTGNATTPAGAMGLTITGTARLLGTRST